MVILASLVVLLSLSRIAATTTSCGDDDDGVGDLAATIVLCCHLRVIGRSSPMQVSAILALSVGVQGARIVIVEATY